MTQDEKLKAIIDAVAAGSSVLNAAVEADISPGELQAIMRRDSVFVEALEHAEALAVGEVEKSLHMKAKGGNQRSIEFFLTNRNPAKWAHRQQVDTTTTTKVDPGVVQTAAEAMRAVLEEASGGGDLAGAVAALQAGPIEEAEVVEDG